MQTEVLKALCQQYILRFLKLLSNVGVRKLGMISEFESRIRWKLTLSHYQLALVFLLRNPLPGCRLEVD